MIFSKEVFGELGRNFFNPARTECCFVYNGFLAVMTFIGFTGATSR
jgi:Na+-transporting NADH:ubiquinone oxidoreductase subunit NqrB